MAEDSRPLSPSVQLWRTFSSRHRLIGSNFYTAILDDPGYITDTGLRKSAEPAAFFDRHALTICRATGESLSCQFQYDPIGARLCRALGHRHNYNVQRFQVDDALISSSVLPQALVCYVNYYGCWEFAFQVSQAVSQLVTTGTSVLGKDHATLVSLCANLAAIDRNVECRKLYTFALTLTQDVLEAAFLRLRMATAELKRLDNAAKAEKIIQELLSFSTSGERGACAADWNAVSAVALNLAALIQVRDGNPETAIDSVRLATELIESALEVGGSLRTSIVERYRIQIWENLATLNLLRGDRDTALDIIARTEGYADAQHPDSRAECAAVRGYMLYRCGDPEQALRSLAKAEALLRESTNPVRHAEVMKLLALVTYDLGQTEEAAYWLSSSRSQVLSESHTI